MFTILYQPTDQSVQVNKTSDEISAIGKWLVDTEEGGNVATIDDLAIALERVRDIRRKGGEACLAVIIE